MAILLGCHKPHDTQYLGWVCAGALSPHDCCLQMGLTVCSQNACKLTWQGLEDCVADLDTHAELDLLLLQALVKYDEQSYPNT